MNDPGSPGRYVGRRVPLPRCARVPPHPPPGGRAARRRVRGRARPRRRPGRGQGVEARGGEPRHRPRPIPPGDRRGPARDTRTADLFALGVSLFEALTGRLPYPAGSQGEVIKAHRDTEPDRLTDHRGTWHPEVVSLVRDLTAKDPAARPTAKEAVR